MEYTGEPYALPLDDLLTVLQTAGKAYQIRAALPGALLPLSARRGESFVAEVVVIAGEIRSCLIRDSFGAVRLEGTRAFDSVRSREQLVWTVQQVQPLLPPSLVSFPSPLVLPWAALAAPVRLSRSSEVLEQMTRRQRQVWLLVDGKRTVHDIAVLLRAPLEELDQELTALETKGLITAGST